MTTQTELFQIRDKQTIKTRLAMMTADLGLIRVIQARQFEAMHGWSARICRSVAEASRGAIISSNAGYVLNRNATADEFAEANSRIYKQGRKMLKRALAERRFRHNAIGRHDHKMEAGK